MNPLVQLGQCGQSPWYDYISHTLITSGELQRMVEEDGLKGMTSNPAIFEKAIAGSPDYEQVLNTCAAKVNGVKEIYEAIAVQDIQDAADVLSPVYKASHMQDGYVSLEVSPDLAFETDATVQEAMRLHQAVNRPNVMIKVPGTPEGLPAIEQLLGMGININVTLLFSKDVYEQVAWAYVRGLETFAKQGGDVRTLASVASFFVSRIDTLVDRELDAKAKHETDMEKRARLEALMGTVAIANAKLAYRTFQTLFTSPQFLSPKAQGAQVQRLLWASTGTKNPQYPDTYYVDQLIGPDTVNTMPTATFEAFRDHGTVGTTLQQGVDEAQATMGRLASSGISMDAVTQTLLKDGAQLFVDAFDKLMGAVSRKREAFLGSKLNNQMIVLAGDEAESTATLKEWQRQNAVRRLWAKDPSLWHSDLTHQALITQSLGWLTITEQQIQSLASLMRVAEEIKSSGFQHVLVLGMGGSSLCPEVLKMTFGIVPSYPELHVLDSTVPGQVKSLEQRVDIANTLCIVASKSGSTVEPVAFHKYFYEGRRAIQGEHAGEHFIAITDPGSSLEQVAHEQGFRAILPGVPDIGGRYSALSNFGMVPGAIMGMDIEQFLRRAEQMRQSCAACVPPEDNPGVQLGITLAQLAKMGRDKVTLIASPTINGLGAWLEQLIAESTGKEGKGIVPVDEEPLGDPTVYGSDRVFVYLRDTKAPGLDQEKGIEAVQKAGHPVIHIAVTDLLNLGQEFFRWEMATAVAGAALGINAFDQPDVQENKDYTKAYLEEFVKTGTLLEPEPALVDQDIQIYADSHNRQALGRVTTFNEMLMAHLDRVRPGDYVAINAYVERTKAIHQIFSNIRVRIRNAKHVATTLGYGPRFLHSTGQLHKGGPNKGVFIQITCDDTEDLPIPGEPYGFGTLKAAQALGDMQSLTLRQRRVIRIHIGSDTEKGLKRLESAVESALP